MYLNAVFQAIKLFVYNLAMSLSSLKLVLPKSDQSGE